MNNFKYAPFFIPQVTYVFFVPMNQLKNYLLKLYRNIISSIAFYPTIILLGFFLLAILVLTLDHDNKITKYLLEQVPFLIINNADTARLILSTFIAGLLSLTVFSFSMVMIILSQASSNFSPRLLPGLIANRKHQIVLGSYLGTIIYSVLVLIAISPSGDAYTLPGFAILLGIVFGISCLGVFVYFIHSISQEIQINNILKKVFERTKRRLLSLQTRTDKEINLPDTQQWAKVYSTENGYYQGINQNLLITLATEFNTIIEIIAIKSVFVLKGIPILKSQKQLSKEEEEKILQCLQYSSDPMDNGSYMNGIQQISEITVKAMSPGINDPGTAINAIDYLSELLALRVQVIDNEYYKDKKETLRVIQQTISFQDLLYELLASLRQYCKHDVLITKKLLLMLEYLLGLSSSKEDMRKILHTQIDILVEDAHLFIKNKQDLQLINQLVSNIQNNVTQVKKKSNLDQS